MHDWQKYELVQTLWRFLKKLNIETQNNPETPFLGIYSKKKTEALILKDIYMHPYSHCSIIYNSQDMEAT